MPTGPVSNPQYRGVSHLIPVGSDTSGGHGGDDKRVLFVEGYPEKADGSFEIEWDGEGLEHTTPQQQQYSTVVRMQGTMRPRGNVKSR